MQPNLTVDAGGVISGSASGVKNLSDQQRRAWVQARSRMVDGTGFLAVYTMFGAALIEGFRIDFRNLDNVDVASGQYLDLIPADPNVAATTRTGNVHGMLQYLAIGANHLSRSLDDIAEFAGLQPPRGDTTRGIPPGVAEIDVLLKLAGGEELWVNIATRQISQFAGDPPFALMPV